MFIYPHWTDKIYTYTQLKPNQKGMVIGAGFRSVFPDFETLDINPKTCPDHEIDLNNTPYPFENETFDKIIAFSILEHLDEKIETLSELHRILKPTGKLYILVPHFSSYATFVDPTHRHGFSALTLDYLIPGTKLQHEFGFYCDSRFKQNQRLISLEAPLSWVPFISKVLSFYPTFWERYLCFVLRGEGVFWELEKINE